MQACDRAEFGALVTDVLAYYRQNASRFVLDLWWNACQAFELEQVRRALSAHATDPDRGQFVPKVADIVRELGGTRVDRAMVAWGKVFDAMSRVGAYTDVAFDDPVIHVVIEDCGGWPKLCRTPMDELGYLQSRFAKAYQAYSGHLSDLVWPRKLAGDRSPDSEYEKRGIPVPEPTFIGDKSTARMVYQRGSSDGARGLIGASDVATLALLRICGKKANQVEAA